MTFAEKFHTARIAANLTQKDIADQIGLDRSAIVHYEKGDSTPSFKNLYKISQILNVSIDELLNP